MFDCVHITNKRHAHSVLRVQQGVGIVKINIALACNMLVFNDFLKSFSLLT